LASDEERNRRLLDSGLAERRIHVALDRHLFDRKSIVPQRVVAHVRRNVPLAALDAAIVVPAYLAPLVLRFDGAVPTAYWSSFKLFLPLAIAIHLAANALFGLYGQMWRYASVQEARSVVLATITGGGFIIATDALVGNPIHPLPLSVVVFGSILALLGFGAVRFQSRLFGLRRRDVVKETTSRVLIVGAGDAGAMVLKDLLSNPALDLLPVGLVDDDPRKVGRALHEIPVLGGREDIPHLAELLDVHQVLLAIPSATGDLVGDVAGLCERADLELRVLPSVREIVGGRVTARDIRDLQIEDLLGRRQIETDLEAVRTIVHRRRVLVTGAGGSIGSELARQIHRFGPTMLVLLDHDETHLHDIESELGPSDVVKVVLADVRDREAMLQTLIALRPEVVFHAAAHKHVPVLERFPAEAVRTNVLGTANLVDAAVAAGVGRFVLISTDKAVRPKSVMGASKWMAEQIVRSVHGRDTIFCAVRFGNVLGSRGSVVPTFLRQIREGGPVTVTDPSMARYFMSIQEAVELVLQAAALSGGGEVLTLEMGEPVNILELAKRLVRLSGRVPGRDIQITIIGARPGEKLMEQVMDPDEPGAPSEHPGIAVSVPDVPDRPAMRRLLSELEALAAAGDDEALSAFLKTQAHRSLREPPVATASAR
jgi:FlaA1/EpsC-like NDP-sugar epimerase